MVQREFIRQSKEEIAMVEINRSQSDFPASAETDHRLHSEKHMNKINVCATSAVKGDDAEIPFSLSLRRGRPSSRGKVLRKKSVSFSFFFTGIFFFKCTGYNCRHQQDQNVGIQNVTSIAVGK
jgi:hypothetical protein